VNSVAIRSNCSSIITRNYCGLLTDIAPTANCSDTCAITTTEQNIPATPVAVAFDSLQSFRGSCFPA
jgi:hypothetical protein